MVCKLLLEKDQSIIDIPDNKGNGPLHKAIKKGHIELAKVLLCYGASIDMKNKAGKTPGQLVKENTCLAGHKLNYNLIRELLIIKETCPIFQCPPPSNFWRFFNKNLL